ncbi:12002_t:CDS:2 [Funneliformis caledonium]|uniref:12002_t:CDS:1 n=1 Tax=Funneliformis caledonium TaxID=1117310 RepID=A0A9N9EGA9_9GLOM|nr:12002_t:CDS:2 [Funneliformis caledonium]
MSNKDKREFEFIEQPGSPSKRPQGSRPSSRSIKMWVLFEGDEDAEKFVFKEDDFANMDEFSKADLDDFKKVLREHYPFLNSIENKLIALFDESLERLDPRTNLSSLDVGKDSDTTIIVRYPISAVNIPSNAVKVTFVYGQKQGKREIPHTSGAFDHLKALAREIFKDLEEGTIYFVNDGTEIWNAYNFNTVVKSQTAQDNNVMLKLKVFIEGKKKYSDWKLKDVFRDILKKPTYNSLSDMPVLDMTELPPLDPPFNQDQLTKFVGEIKVKLSSLRDEFGNETKNRIYIDTFMTHAVDYIRTHINKSVRLDVEQGLDGSHGNGPLDYWVKLVEVLLFLCEAKAEDMNQGSAQAIVQAQSGIEQLNKLGYEELLIYGIASTGKLWRFIRWSGSSENPEVHISKEYTCNFKGELADEKEILTYIAQILTAQVYLYDKNSEHPSKRVKVNEK